MAEKIKLLIIDDNENECKTFKNIFDAKGYLTLVAHNSQEAIRSVTETQPDIILPDLVIKGDKNAIEIFKDVKKLSPGSRRF